MANLFHSNDFALVSPPFRLVEFAKSNLGGCSVITKCIRAKVMLRELKMDAVVAPHKVTSSEKHVVSKSANNSYP